MLRPLSRSGFPPAIPRSRPLRPGSSNLPARTAARTAARTVALAAALAVALTIASMTLLAAGCSTPNEEAAPPPLNEGPLIRMEERRWDLGRVSQFVDSVRVFRFRNDGTEPLRITNIETTCGCTAVAPKDSVVAPGASSSLQVTFSSGSFEGSQTKIVALFTNDPAEPRIDLVVLADVRPLIRVENRTLDFTHVQQGESRVLVAVLESDPEDPFTVTSVTGGADHVDWSVLPQPPSPNGHAVRLEAHLRPDAPLGAFHKRIEVLLRHPIATRERVFVRGIIYSYFRPEETRINFATVRAGKSYQGKLRIETDGDRPYRILEAQTTAAFLRPALTEERGNWELAVALDASNAPPRFRERIVLKTDDPAQPEISIEAVGVVVK